MNPAPESPESPSTSEEVLEVPEPYIESGDHGESWVNELPVSTIVWAGGLVLDSTGYFGKRRRKQCQH